MQIVIDIPNWLYNAIMECKEPNYSKSLGEAVRDGTPLPKGYGRLGDLDELEQRISNYIEYYEHMMDEFTLLQEKFILEGIKDTPTIIEADKEEKE